MSGITSYLTYITTVISNTVFFVLGLFASITVPFYICHYLRIFIESPGVQSPPPPPNNPANQQQPLLESNPQFWGNLQGIVCSLSVLGYLASFIFAYLDTGSVAEGALKGAITVSAISVGVVGTGFAIYYVGKALEGAMRPSG